ncbi:serine hydrolase [Chryseobacterium sp. MYb264]|uniref:serine hydrolase domain-containing protein n=1 Tax=Chryseobacterium sp. MYb264 TaxID=2745153 RepID=UPI002E0E0EA1|nr:serine hydrolase [Chryseobacterium sp. MYb264]
MRLLFSLVATAVFSFHSFAQNREAAFQKIMDSAYKVNPETLGMIVHIESPAQKISWSYAVGHNGNNNSSKIDPQQPLLIASNTKPYISSTILQLIEQNKLNIDEPVKNLLSEKTVKALSGNGYNLDKINLKHLLSHTSGINDYVTEDYFKFIDEHKKYNWTRDEQIALASKQPKVGEPGTVFRYADINYVVLSEIIEIKTGKPFYKAVRELLDYKKLGLKNTWFVQLENKPKNSLPLVNQFWSGHHWEIKDLNPSWDLYGGGGMASNVDEMAKYFQLLFNGKVIKNPEILKLIYTDVPPNLEINYCLGIRKIKVGDMMAYNHGGGLGTDVIYLPELDSTISIASLDAEKRPVVVGAEKLLAKKLKTFYKK